MSSVSQTSFTNDALRFRYYDMYISTRISDWSTPLFQKDPTPGHVLAYSICIVAMPIFLAIGLGDVIFTLLAWPLTWIMNKIYYHTQGNAPRSKTKPIQQLIEPQSPSVLPQQPQIPARVEQQQPIPTTSTGVVARIRTQVNWLLRRQGN